jgi:DNA-binding response OmpR family regulator
MPARILVAEDDRKQAAVIRRYLEREGHETAVVHDGRAAIQRVRQDEPDLLVLDLMLPSVGGLDVCRVLRSERDLPIIMLTARSAEDDLVLGFALGADDYVTKPYRPRELLARVHAVLRRTVQGGGAEPGRYRVGGLLVDENWHEVHVDGVPVATTPAEFTLLACLAAAPGRAFTRKMLLEQVGGFERDVTLRTIDVHVMNIRRKIEQVPSRPRYLRTVYGVGYKLVDPSVEGVGGAP